MGKVILFGVAAAVLLCVAVYAVAVQVRRLFGRQPKEDYLFFADRVYIIYRKFFYYCIECGTKMANHFGRGSY